jgi:hypothetical protein
MGGDIPGQLQLGMRHPARRWEIGEIAVLKTKVGLPRAELLWKLQ